MILSLLVNIFKAERELPENKIDLYDKCINYISKKREIDFKKLPYNFKLIQSILDSNITFEKLSDLSKYTNIEISKEKIIDTLGRTFEKSYSNSNETLNAINEFLKFSCERTELFVLANKEDYYKFYHRSFFEYYYAKYMLKICKSNQELFNELSNFGNDSEIFDITAALLKKDDFDRYIEFIDYIFDELEKCIQSKSEERLLQIISILTLILQISSERIYIKQYYELIFSKAKLLNKIDDKKVNITSIYNILIKYKSGKELDEDIIKYYRNEVISAYIYIDIRDNVRKIKYKNFKISYIFGIFVEKGKLFQNSVNGIIDELGVQKTAELLEKYGEPMDRETQTELNRNQVIQYLIDSYDADNIRQA